MNMKQIQSALYNRKPLNVHLSTWTIKNIDMFTCLVRRQPVIRSMEDCPPVLVLITFWKIMVTFITPNISNFFAKHSKCSSFIFMISFWLERWSLQINKGIIMPLLLMHTFVTFENDSFGETLFLLVLWSCVRKATIWYDSFYFQVDEQNTLNNITMIL